MGMPSWPDGNQLCPAVFSCSKKLPSCESRVRSVPHPLLRVMEGSWRVVQLSPMWLACWPFCVLVEFVPSVISSRLMASCAALSIVDWHSAEKR